MKIPPTLKNQAGRLSAYGFRCGHVEQVGQFVTIDWEHCCYHVKRHPEHANGHAWESCRTITEARKIARKLAKEATQ